MTAMKTWKEKKKRRHGTLYLSHIFLHKLTFFLYQHFAESSKFQTATFAPKLKPSSLEIPVMNS